MRQRYCGRENTFWVQRAFFHAEDWRIAAAGKSDLSMLVRPEHIGAETQQQPDASLPCRDITCGEPLLA
jgi:hypothetical protein